MTDAQQRRRIAGSVLIIVGLVLFILQFAGGMNEGLVLALVGVAFLAAYFYRANYALLIPGCILTGLGLGVWVEGLQPGWGEPVLLGLGTGFVAIYVIALVRDRTNNPWPLIPGAILLLIGFVPESDTLEWLFEVGWPLILVVIGVFIFFGGFRGFRDMMEGASGPDATPPGGSPTPGETGQDGTNTDAPEAGSDRGSGLAAS